MGAIPGLLGVGGGAAGSSFAGPTSSAISQGVNQGQAQTAYNQSQNSLAQQQALLGALQGQGGLQNQTNLYGQMGNVAGQYQNIANGSNPLAQTQLAQNTAANVAQTGALMAGQRGAGQNVGLMARQIGQQGAATQQNSALGAANLQAQTQLAGLQGLQSQQGMQAGLANTMAGNQIGQTNAITGANQAQYGNVLNALGALNTTGVGMQSNINNVSGQLANTQMQGQQALLGGLLNSAGGAMSSMAEGGEVENDASADSSTPSFGSDAGAAAFSPKSSSGSGSGGSSAASLLPLLAMAAAGGGEATVSQSAYPGQSAFGQFLSQVQAGGSANTSTPAFGSDAGAKPLEQGVQKLASTNINAMGSPGGGAGSGAGGGMDMAAMMGSGGMTSNKDFRGGGKVKATNPKEKAVKGGDSYSNDKIPAVLSEHEIVLPRSVTLSKDPVGNAARFVAATLAKRRGKK